MAGVARFSGLYFELCLWLEAVDNVCRCRAEIEECEDADASKMQARPNFVPIDQLPSFIGKKARTQTPAELPLTSVSNMFLHWSGRKTVHVQHAARLQQIAEQHVIDECP